MTLNGLFQYVCVYGARHKKTNDDRPILSVAKM